MQRIALLLVLLAAPLAIRADDFSVWRIRNFPTTLSDEMTSGPDADADGDGITNLSEYIHGTDPLTPNAAPTTQRFFGDAFLVGVLRNTLATDATIIAEVSTDLATWSALPADIAFVSSTAQNASLELAEYSATAPASTFAAQFIRFQLSQESLDTDGDGMPDAWEIYYGLNPNDPSDAAQDSDGDGISNGGEFVLGGNPTLPDLDTGGGGGGDNGAGNNDGGNNGGGGGSSSGVANTDNDARRDPEDTYPNDQHRYDPPYLRHYGILDLSLISGSTALPPSPHRRGRQSSNFLPHKNPYHLAAFQIRRLHLPRWKNR